MSKIKIRQEIRIERNIIEQSLMRVKDFLKSYKHVVAISFFAFIAASVLLISGLVYREISSNDNLINYENILERYGKAAAAEDKAGTAKALGELRNFVETSYFGSSRELACYALGGIYYEEKKFPEARKYLQRYAKLAPKSSLFVPLALFKAAIAAEESKDLEGALGIYTELEEKFGDSVIIDQALYNMARVCAKKKDVLSAKKYYNKIIVSFPDSPFKDRARKQLFLLGAVN